MLSEDEKKAIEECENFLKEKSSSYINYYNDEGNQRTFWFSNLKEVLNLIEKQSKIIQAMAGEIAQFRNECDLENDTKETVIEEYEEQYIIWRKFFKESR